ncbi:DUF4259 domain-containing protein [Kitasatospora sp. NPDC058032]|uniref:DUF4259 domain-containing protein n=1 Tax=Kitasatospora sp. NPDC058032 TaxID=3346307 RepID=UPI0036D88115
MGTWGIGPFESDHACEFGDEIDLALPEMRYAVIEERLVRYLDGGAGHYLRDEAVAAASLVAAQCPGGADALSSGYGPKEPIPELPARLLPLAARALDRVLSDVQGDMDAWARIGRQEKGEQWLDGLERLRVALDPGSPYTVVYTPGPLLPHQIGTRTVHHAFGVDRIRALPGAGEGATGQLVRQITEAAAQLDQAHKDVRSDADYALQRLDAFRVRLQEVALGDGSGEFHPSDVPVFTVPASLGQGMAQRADRHRHLSALIDLYRATTVPAPDGNPRAAAARTRAAAAHSAVGPATSAAVRPTATSAAATPHR